MHKVRTMATVTPWELGDTELCINQDSTVPSPHVRNGVCPGRVQSRDIPQVQGPHPPCLSTLCPYFLFFPIIRTPEFTGKAGQSDEADLNGKRRQLGLGPNVGEGVMLNPCVACEGIVANREAEAVRGWVAGRCWPAQLVWLSS